MSAGILQGTPRSLQGNILNNATVVFDQASTGTYAGDMRGTGSLTKAGTGTVTLERHQQLRRRHDRVGRHPAGNTPSLQGNILNNAAVVFDQTGNGTYAGVMSGTGGMTLQGGGVLSLTGTNTYTGPPPSTAARWW